MAWQVFLQPFTKNLWLVLLLHGLVATFVIRCLHHFGSRRPVPSLLGEVTATLSLYWCLLNTYLSKPPPSYLSVPSLGVSLRAAVFVALLCSTVVWAVYRASLTSELVSQVMRKPFDSLETFLQSDYQY